VGSIGVSWTPNSAVQTAQHRIYLRDSVGKIVDSITDTASTRSMVYFPSSPDKKTVLPNRAYMVNIRAFNKIAPGMLCTTFIYDNGSNNDVSFKLPYRYVSTFLSLPPIDSGVMIGITGGIFSMGTIWSKEGLNTIHNCKPVHEVILPSFYLGATEITTTRYAAFLTAQDTALCKVIDTIIIGHTAGIGANDTVFFTTILLAQDTLLQGNRKSIHIVKKDLLFIVDSLLYRNHPVTNITWKGAAAFCNWLSAKNTLNKCYDTAWRYIPGANGYRLPTEAEFEYAHSAAFTGAKQRYPWGYAADESRYASQKNKLGPVGRYLGYFGLFDLSGNVSEWCNDYSDIANPSDSSVYYTECAQKGVVINPLGPTNSAKGHIIRGGSHTGTHNQNCSVWRDASGALSDDRGFRVARNK
jgi:formylglycine-generating enzyme required for sulfatase activity